MLFDDFNDDSVNPDSRAYIAGEITETSVEIVVTLGGASLRKLATQSVRYTLEGGARRAFRTVNNLSGGFIHHINPIKGHPNGRIARYPLPFRWAARGFWNMKWVPNKAAHLAEHAKMLRLEALDRLREATIMVRQIANEVGLYLEGARGHCDWSVDVKASVRGATIVQGPIPPTPQPEINAYVETSENGIGTF